MLEEWDLVLRVVAAGLLGGLIGYDRELEHKPAGIRTHVLVAAGAALFVGAAVLVAQSSGAAGELAAKADMSRVLAGVVTGVGFLGAGSIITQGDRVRGLTTAAGVWVTAAIGSVIGLGYWILGVAGTAVVLLVYVLSHIAGRMRRDHTGDTGDAGDTRGE
ncbi:MAG: MgtC/SapB family protein [Acidimicrobiia bacterium]|nr:MgtC/SapB family protein [Acidimicrobiia bacterium]